jgi:iron complex transport system ATP-binding protein
LLEAEHITFTAGGRDLISDVTAAFEPGKLHLIIGPNGAGKSTLIKVLAGFLKPAAGTVRYAGKDVGKIPETELAKRRAVLSQAIDAAFPLLVREVVMMGRYPHFGGRPRASDERVVDEMMEFFDITDFARRNYQTLSGGERQRVNFARILAQLWHADAARNDGLSQRYLFLDEPLTFLDIRHQIDFMKKVRTFAASPDVVTVGVVHDLNLAARFADHILIIDGGRLAAAGPPGEVLTADRIRETFGVEPTFVTIDTAGVHIVLD